MIPLTTPIFDFLYVISALTNLLTTATATPTLSLVKTSLKLVFTSDGVGVGVVIRSAELMIL